MPLLGTHHLDEENCYYVLKSHFLTDLKAYFFLAILNAINLIKAELWQWF